MTRTDAVALVTGAGSGIGRAVALALLDRGYRVALVGRRPGPLDDIAATWPDRSLALPADITDPAAVTALFDQVRDTWGRLDLLFNNAGRGAPAMPLEDLPVETWRAVVDLNLTGSFLCLQAAFRIMRDQTPQGGRIINNGSISAQSPRPHAIAYTATKHAVTGLTKAASLDGRRYNIACGQIDIGNAATDMTTRMAEGVPQADGRIAPEPTMDVNHVAQAVIYMDSLPLDANVPFMTVMATKMPLVGRG